MKKSGSRALILVQATILMLTVASLAATNHVATVAAAGDTCSVYTPGIGNLGDVVKCTCDYPAQQQPNGAYRTICSAVEWSNLLCTTRTLGEIWFCTPLDSRVALAPAFSNVVSSRSPTGYTITVKSSAGAQSVRLDYGDGAYDLATIPPFGTTAQFSHTFSTMWQNDYVQIASLVGTTAEAVALTTVAGGINGGGSPPLTQGHVTATGNGSSCVSSANGTGRYESLTSIVACGAATQGGSVTITGSGLTAPVNCDVSCEPGFTPGEVLRVGYMGGEVFDTLNGAAQVAVECSWCEMTVEQGTVTIAANGSIAQTAFALPNSATTVSNIAGESGAIVLADAWPTPNLMMMMVPISILPR